MSEPNDPAKPVLDWLAKVDAQFLWCEEIEGFGLLRGYTANGRFFLLQTKPAGSRFFGWEIYVPAHDGNDTAKTFEAAEKYLFPEEGDDGDPPVHAGRVG